MEEVFFSEEKRGRCRITSEPEKRRLYDFQKRSPSQSREQGVGFNPTSKKRGKGGKVQTQPSVGRTIF